MATVTEALARLSAAGQGFGELVTAHLTTVLAVEGGTRHIVIGARTFASDFQRGDTNPHFLAARLVWSATAIRLAHNAKAAGRTLDVAGTRAACWEAQRRFLSQFPDSAEWIAYMDPERPRNQGPDSAA